MVKLKDILAFSALLVMFGNTAINSSDANIIGKVGNVNSQKKEIVVNIESGSTPKMGDILYVRSGDEKILMVLTFPMMTTSVCTLKKGYGKYLGNIKNGMDVYKYDKSQTDSLDYSKLRYIKELRGHTADIWCVALSPNGSMMASASEDKTIRLWDFNGNCIRTIRGHLGEVWCVAFSNNSKFLVSGGWYDDIRLWNTSGEQVAIFKKEDDAYRYQGDYYYSGVYYSGVAFSPDDRIIAAGGNEGILRIWTTDGSLLKSIHVDDTGSENIFSVSFTPDSNYIVTGSGSYDSEDNIIRIWTIKGEPVRVLKGHSGEVYSVSVSPDGKLIASASGDNTVRLWSFDGKLQKIYKNPYKIETVKRYEDYNLPCLFIKVVFSPDGRSIAAGSRDGNVYIWSLNGNLVKVLKGHSYTPYSIVFHPDGKTLVSGSLDTTIRLWSIN